MRDRQGEVWEAFNYMNGQRVVLIVASREARAWYGECTVHTVLHLTGLRAGMMLEWTEQGPDWDRDPTKKRLV